MNLEEGRIREFWVRGYRSLREFYLQPGPLTVLIGANGCGKTNVYRAIELLAKSARGEFARALATEGGMPSALWAGGLKSHESVGLTLHVKADPFSYELQCGLPKDRETFFQLDPEVKREEIWVGDQKRPSSTLVSRDHSVLQVLDENGGTAPYACPLRKAESVLSQLRDAQRFPELALLREVFASWRFYHSFRTDRDAPSRQSNVPCRTPVLADDGRDLACAIATVMEDGDGDRFQKVTETLFEKGVFRLARGAQRSLGFEVFVDHLARPLRMSELSDGEVRFLCLAAALLTPEPPRLMVLNEPETSLHPRLLPALADLIASAAQEGQVIVTTHSTELADQLQGRTGEQPIPLEMQEGKTVVTGAGPIGHRRGWETDEDE